MVWVMKWDYTLENENILNPTMEVDGSDDFPVKNRVIFRFYVNFPVWNCDEMIIPKTQRRDSILHLRKFRDFRNEHDEKGC